MNTKPITVCGQLQCHECGYRQAISPTSANTWDLDAPEAPLCPRCVVPASVRLVA